MLQQASKQLSCGNHCVILHPKVKKGCASSGPSSSSTTSGHTWNSVASGVDTSGNCNNKQQKHRQTRGWPTSRGDAYPQDTDNKIWELGHNRSSPSRGCGKQGQTVYNSSWSPEGIGTGKNHQDIPQHQVKVESWTNTQKFQTRWEDATSRSKMGKDCVKGKIAEHYTTNKEMIAQISDNRQELINRFVMKKMIFVDWQPENSHSQNLQEHQPWVKVKDKAICSCWAFAKRTKYGWIDQDKSWTRSL